MPMRDEPGYFSERYRWRVDKNNPSWQAYRFVCFALTWGRDGAFPFSKAQQLDHIGYRTLYREIPLFDVIPLSVVNHRLVTQLRDKGYRGPVNLYLRCAGLCWLSFDLLLISAVVCLASGHFDLFLRTLYGMGSSVFWVLCFLAGRVRA
jgi:hypothetical protein